MKRLGILKDRLRALVRRDAVIEEIDEEMRFHVEMETQTNIERGMLPEEARAAALRSFGNPGRMKDLASGAGGYGNSHKIHYYQKNSGFVHKRKTSCVQ